MLLTHSAPDRLRAIEQLRVHEQFDDPALDSLVKQAATLCSAPAAYFSIDTTDSLAMIALFGCSFNRTLPREGTLCAHVVETQRFHCGGVYRDDTDLNFYAGTPVFALDTCIGSLGVLDYGERRFTAAHRNALAAIASAIGGILEERMNTSALDPDLLETGLGFTDNAWTVFALRPDERMPRIEYANARALELSAVSLEELTNDPERIYDLPGYADAILLAAERAETDDTTPAYVEVQAADGGVVFAEVRTRRLSNGPDGSLRFVTISRDITEQKRAEAFRDLLVAAIRQTPDGVLIVRMTDDNLRPEVVYANDAFRTLTGYDPFAHYPRLLGDESDRAGVLAAVRGVREGRHVEGETIAYRHDGSTFIASYRGHCIDAPDAHAVITIKDVTKDRRQERQLAMLSAAIEESEDFIGVADDTPVEQGGPFVIYVNPAMANAAGYEPEELIGKPYNYLHSPDNPAKMSERVRETISKGMPGFRELLLRRKDGTDFWIEMVGRTFTDPATNRTFRLSVGRDITLRRRAFNQTALLLEASDQSSDAIVLYEPNAAGDLVVTYENAIAAEFPIKRLSTLWISETDSAKRVREILERGGEVREVFAEQDDNDSPVLVQFSARSVRNEARLEAIVTIERIIAKANEGQEYSGQSLLVRVAGMLPALNQARSTDERLAILRAILLDAFGAEVRVSSAHLKDENVHVATGWKGATFKLRDRAYAARWTRDLDNVALTSLRLCVEAAIDEERKAAKP